MSQIFRADHCGSLIRPDSVRRARVAKLRGEIDEAELHRIEDEAILGALELQRKAGLGIYTDGEFRRRFWFSGLEESLEGIVEGGTLRPIERGDGKANPELAIPNPVVVEKLRRRPDTIIAREIAFLKKHSPGPFKVTVPAQGSIAMLGTWFKEGVTDKVYSSREELTDTLIGFLEDDVRTAADAGVPYIQIDNPRYAAYIGGAGVPPPAGAAPLEDVIAWDNRLLRAARRPGVTVGLHICLGTYVGSGPTTLNRLIPYDPAMVARIFSELEADVLTVEYSERSGTLESLKLLSGLGKKVIALGMVNVLSPQVEPAEELVRKLEQAAKYVPLDNLAICNNCGFAGTAADAFLNEDQQLKKLQRMVEVSKTVWKGR